VTVVSDLFRCYPTQCRHLIEPAFWILLVNLA
jgi:hypothetical protein